MCNKVKQRQDNHIGGSIIVIYIYGGKGTLKIIPSKLLYELSFYVHTSQYNNNTNFPKKERTINLIFLAPFSHY